MKDRSETELTDSRPDMTTVEAIDFCLRSLYQDRKHSIFDQVANNCTYEELIGALLLAQDAVRELHDLKEEMEEQAPEFP